MCFQYFWNPFHHSLSLFIFKPKKRKKKNPSSKTGFSAINAKKEAIFLSEAKVGAMAERSNGGSDESEEAITQLELLKKLKRLNSLEPSFGVLGFFFVSVLFITAFFYLDFETVPTKLRSSGAWLGLQTHDSFPPLSSSSSSFSSSTKTTTCENERPEFLDEGGDGCNIFEGGWVWDESYPLYQSLNCSFVDPGFRCSENGRPDGFFTKWRWQPKDCNLPRWGLFFLYNYCWTRFWLSFLWFLKDENLPYLYQRVIRDGSFSFCFVCLFFWFVHLFILFFHPP